MAQNNNNNSVMQWLRQGVLVAITAASGFAVAYVTDGELEQLVSVYGEVGAFGFALIAFVGLFYIGLQHFTGLWGQQQRDYAEARKSDDGFRDRQLELQQSNVEALGALSVAINSLSASQTQDRAVLYAHGAALTSAVEALNSHEAKAEERALASRDRDELLESAVDKQTYYIVQFERQVNKLSTTTKHLADNVGNLAIVSQQAIEQIQDAQQTITAQIAIIRQHAVNPVDFVSTTQSMERKEHEQTIENADDVDATGSGDQPVLVGASIGAGGASGDGDDPA